MYDGGVRVPLLIRWPGTVSPGTITDEPVTSPDFYPTLLAAAGLPPLPAQHVDGVSFLPLLRGDQFERGPIFWHYPHYANQGGRPGAAVRDGDWKLIEFFEDEHTELYDLRHDPSERHDLAGSPQLAPTASRLYGGLRAWQASVRALRPTPNPHEPFADTGPAP